MKLIFFLFFFSLVDIPGSTESRRSLCISFWSTYFPRRVTNENFMVDVRNVNMPLNIICHATVLGVLLTLSYKLYNNVEMWTLSFFYTWENWNKVTVEVTIVIHSSCCYIPLHYNWILCFFKLNTCFVFWRAVLAMGRAFEILGPGTLRHQHVVSEKTSTFPQLRASLCYTVVYRNTVLWKSSTLFPYLQDSNPKFYYNFCLPVLDLS